VYAGLDVFTVPGATGRLDTNYRGKAEYALRELEEKDFVLIHVEAPDEAEHNGCAPDKVRAIKRIDEEMVAPILERARRGGGLAFLVLPDHPTPVAIRTQSQEPVPFLFYPALPRVVVLSGKAIYRSQRVINQPVGPFFTKKGNLARGQIPFKDCDGAEGGTRTPTGFPTTLMQ
jgi:hypothetical protein